MSKITKAMIAEARDVVARNFEARREYERSKNENNENIQKNLRKYEKNVTDATLTLFLQQKIDLNFMNIHERSTSRLNVYCVEKVTRLDSAFSLDAFTKHVLLSMRALQQNDMIMTHKDAQSACTLACSTDATKEKILKTTKRQLHIAANTASTQSSSSLNALVHLKLARETRDENNKIAFVLDLENAHVKKLFEQLDK